MINDPKKGTTSQDEDMQEDTYGEKGGQSSDVSDMTDLNTETSQDSTTDYMEDTEE